MATWNRSRSTSQRRAADANQRGEAPSKLMLNAWVGWKEKSKLVWCNRYGSLAGEATWIKRFFKTLEDDGECEDPEHGEVQGRHRTPRTVYVRNLIIDLCAKNTSMSIYLYTHTIVVVVMCVFK